MSVGAHCKNEPSVFIVSSFCVVWKSKLFNFLLFQHFAILLKYIIHVAIPDIPTWVKEEMAKLDYQRREAFKVKLK